MPPTVATNDAQADAGTNAPPPRASQIDPDGNDDPIDADEQGSVPTAAHFEQVGKAPLALQRICDLTVLGDALYAAHARSPLGTDGATVTRYQPDHGKPSELDEPRDSAGRIPPNAARDAVGRDNRFEVAFDWNRPGEPTAGGGAGQGFLRVHRIAGKLFVPDADPPYLGFGLSGIGTEGYVFISNQAGDFAKTRSPGHKPPRSPSDDQPGAALLPGALHVFDAIRYRGHFYATTGAIPPGHFYSGDQAPGALLMADEQLHSWKYAVPYPYPVHAGVWRLTFAVRFRDRLYTGLESFERAEANDYVQFEPRPGSDHLEPSDGHAVRVTGSGGARTLRWYADRGKLYWIAWSGGEVTLRVTEDGDAWKALPIPPDVGAPLDIVRFGEDLLVLTEWALLKLVDASPGGRRFAVVATVASLKDTNAFRVSDGYCAAPMAVFRGELYVGGQRGGALYKLAADR